MVGKPSYWLMKSEPDVFSIHDLRDCGITGWDGVRNYQARNYLRNGLKVGDGVLFYHSNGHPSGISGIAKVVKGGYPDDTAFDPEDEHYDPKSDSKHPTWYRVDLKFIRAFPAVIPLPLLRKTPGLEKMVLFRNGRLSVQPVSRKEWALILGLEKRRRSPKTPKSRSRR
jgi:predicted RNA-binding protein with PUA-like domain